MALMVKQRCRLSPTKGCLLHANRTVTSQLCAAFPSVALSHSFQLCSLVAARSLTRTFCPLML